MHRLPGWSRRFFARTASQRVFTPTVFEGASKIEPPLPVPEHIPRPTWAARPGGHPERLPDTLFAEVKSPEAIDKVRRANQLAARALQAALAAAQPGATTHDADRAAFDVTVAAGAYPTGIGFHGFPKGICTSVNEVVVHGIPDDRVLKDGDICNIDVSVYLDGHYGDNSAMALVGTVDEEGKRLCEVTRRSMEAAIEAVGPGVPLSKVGEVIHGIADAEGYGVIREFCGHFIGRELHMSPIVKHYRNDDEVILRPGMTFTIEPILCEGTHQCYQWADGWTIVTRDHGRTAQWEHTVLITEDGREILSKLVD